MGYYVQQEATTAVMYTVWSKGIHYVEVTSHAARSARSTQSVGTGRHVTCGTMAMLLRSSCSEMLSTLTPSISNSSLVGSTNLHSASRKGRHTQFYVQETAQLSRQNTALCTWRLCDRDKPRPQTPSDNNVQRHNHKLREPHLNSAAMRLLLPAPVRPTTPSLVLPGMVNDTSLQSHDANVSE
jgi:hypothetical protein